ncbi:hypothetical protein BTVI_05903 [Pitangus sulphuratus]|nr:hypothetical protein BTVI_05903 [Pitangus sulphuratus]
MESYGKSNREGTRWFIWEVQYSVGETGPELGHLPLTLINVSPNNGKPIPDTATQLLVKNNSTEAAKICLFSPMDATGKKKASKGFSEKELGHGKILERLFKEEKKGETMLKRYVKYPAQHQFIMFKEDYENLEEVEKTNGRNGGFNYQR